MTVTTTREQQLAYATQAEADGRYADAAHAYQEALDNMPHPTSALVQNDRATIEDRRRVAVMRSQFVPHATVTEAGTP